MSTAEKERPEEASGNVVPLKGAKAAPKPMGKKMSGRRNDLASKLVPILIFLVLGVLAGAFAYMVLTTGASAPTTTP